MNCVYNPFSKDISSKVLNIKLSTLEHPNVIFSIA